MQRWKKRKEQEQKHSCVTSKIFLLYTQTYPERENNNSVSFKKLNLGNLVIFQPSRALKIQTHSNPNPELNLLKSIFNTCTSIMAWLFSLLSSSKSYYKYVKCNKLDSWTLEKKQIYIVWVTLPRQKAPRIPKSCSSP